MRTFLRAAGVLSVLLVSSQASAQFANKSAGLHVGYTGLGDRLQKIERSIPIGLYSTLYIESGFDSFGSFDVMIMRDPIVGADFIGLAGSIGIRYLFMEESLRPYAGLAVSYLHLFWTGEQNFAGPAAIAGFDYFVTESISVGVKGEGFAYLMINVQPIIGFGIKAAVATYF